MRHGNGWTAFRHASSYGGEVRDYVVTRARDLCLAGLKEGYCGFLSGLPFIRTGAGGVAMGQGGRSV